MSASHNSDIDITKTIEPAPPSQAGFGRVAYMSDGSLTSASTNFKTYTASANFSDLVSQGELTQDAADALQTAFAQSPSPSTVAVIGLDTTASDTYVSAFNDAIAAGHEFYAVVPDVDTDTEIADLAGAVESTDKIMAADVSGAEWLTSDVPSAYSSVAENLRFAPVYHPDAANEYPSIAWLAERLSFDPDTISVPFTTGLVGVSPYADGSTITTGEKQQAHDNGANTVLEFGSSSTYLKPGQNISGNPLYEVLTLDWFGARLSNRLASLLQRKDAAGQKLGVDQTGQDIFVGEIDTQIDLAIEADHLIDERTDEVNVVRAPDPIPDADINSQTLRATAVLVFKTSANKFAVQLNFQR